MATECVLVAELGPNPAALAEVLWALARQRDLCVREAFVLTSARGAHYLEREFLAPGAAYDQLEVALGDALVRRERLHTTVVRDDAGTARDDERTAEEAAAWNEARWQNARAAMRAARATQVVFALTGGRRRTSSAVSTVVFQLMARTRDLLVDVRVGDRRVEGARAGFWFPEQRHQRLAVDEGVLFARDVAVHLVDVQVPRLRRLLGGRELTSWADALSAGQRAVEDVPTVSLSLDVASEEITVNDKAVKLSEAEFVWFAALVIARARGDDGWLRSDDVDAPREVLCRMRAAKHPGWAPRAAAWRRVLAGTFEDDDKARVSKYRSTAVAHFEKALAKVGLSEATIRAALPEQEVRSEVIGKVTAKFTVWRLPIDAERITVA